MIRKTSLRFDYKKMFCYNSIVAEAISPAKRFNLMHKLYIEYEYVKLVIVIINKTKWSLIISNRLALLIFSVAEIRIKNILTVELCLL